MANLSTPAGQIVGVIPDGNEDPNIPGDLMAIAKAIEKRLVGVYATASARDTATNTIVEEGMFAFTRDNDKLWYRSATAWVEFPPRPMKVGSGTSVPAASDPNYINGDVFFKV